MSIKYIFCEGDSKSIDRLLLEKILKELPTYPSIPSIIASGGKGNLPNFISGYIESVKARKIEKSNIIGFRDRDFDAPVPDTEALILSRTAQIFMTYRACIENYLIDEQILFDYLISKHSFEGSIETVFEMFRHAATDIKHYTAARLAIAELRKPVRIGTSWMEADGKLPQSMTEQVCYTEAVEYLRSSLEPIGELLQPDKFGELYQKYVNLFDDVFFTDRKHMIWFHGKDLMSALLKVPHMAKINFSRSDYYKYAMEQFNFRNFPDLVQLFDKLNEA